MRSETLSIYLTISQTLNILYIILHIYKTTKIYKNLEHEKIIKKSLVYLYISIIIMFIINSYYNSEHYYYDISSFVLMISSNYFFVSSLTMICTYFALKITKSKI